MGIIELGSASGSTLTQRQRWSIYLSLLTLLLFFGVGIWVRNSSLGRFDIYSNPSAGIIAQYPQGWLQDTTSSDYVFRVRDMTYSGFKTTMQVSIQPATSDVVERNVLDRLSLIRSQTFIDYSVLGYDDYILPNEITAVAMLYTYVSRESSPFLEGIPTIVIGTDILTIRRGQAIIITFRADSSIYEQELSRFERFVENLNF